MNNLRNTYQIDKIDHYYYIKYDTNTFKYTHTGHSLHPFGTFIGKEQYDKMTNPFVHGKWRHQC